MSSHKKDKKISSEVKAAAPSTPSKTDLRTKLEAVLAVPMMKTVALYSDDELMTLFGKLKDAYDLVHTRTLLLPREKRLTEEQREMLKAAAAELAETEGGVVEEDDESDDGEDGFQLDSDSDDGDDAENPQVAEYMKLFKQRLVLNDMVERENSADGADFVGEDDFDFEEDEEDEESDEEAPASKKVTKKGGVKIQELPSDSEEEEKENGEDEEDEEDGEDGEDDGIAVSRQFMASFSLLDADGNVVADGIELKCQDIYEGSGFEGEHSLAWNEDIIFNLNTVDGDIVEPETPSFEELQAALESDEALDEEILGHAMPNTWDGDVADALKEKAGFPAELSSLQFTVIMLHVMSRIVKNAARTPGPGPADSLLPAIVLELHQYIEDMENEEDDAAAEGMEVDEDDEEESSEEEAPAPKQKKPSAPVPAQKKHDDKKKDAKPQHQNNKKDAKPQHHDNKNQKPHHDAKKDHKPQHDGKKDHKPHHDNKNQKPQHHNNKEQQNNKKRPHPTGDRPQQGHQNKKPKSR
jgi:hypothetical protein